MKVNWNKCAGQYTCDHSGNSINKINFCKSIQGGLE
jgi:hypothetical protein